MSPPERRNRPTAGNGGTAQSSETLVRVDSDHTAQTDNSRDLLHDTGVRHG